MKKMISPSVVRRLPRYLRKLEELEKSQVTRISSFTFGEMLGQTASQIRQDFSCFGAFGQQGYGYEVHFLKEQITQILGMDRGFKVILIGVGNIGRALIDKFVFNDWGLELCCAFDCDPEIIGTSQNDVQILDEQLLEQYLDENLIDIAVLCVPKTEAEPMAKRIIACGVEAIWNFTNVEIVEPNSKTIVENLNFSDSLLALSFFLAQRRDEV